MKLRNIIIPLVLFLSSETIKGQSTYESIDSIVKEYVNRLNINGIDTVCVYEYNCHYWGPNVFFLWKNKGRTFMNYSDYFTLNVSEDSIWNFFFTNIDTIQKEEIKTFEYIKMENGVEVRGYSLIPSHSCSHNIQIMIKQDTILDKVLWDKYLSKEETDVFGEGVYTNINYQYNINTNLNKLQILINRTIERINKDGKFARRRRK